MIKEIVTHGIPVHLDEFSGKIMLARHGEEKLPGVSTARFRALIPQDDVGELSRNPEVVLLGIGAAFRNELNSHRIFDEHVVNDDKSQEKDCVATLVAKFLGLDQNPTWGKALKAILHTDKNMPTLTLDLAPTVIRFQEQGWGLDDVLYYAEQSIIALVKEQEQFFQADPTKIRKVELMLKEEQCWIAIIEDDQAATPSQARYFTKAVIVVIKNKNGQIQILTSNDRRLDMRDVVRALRLREQWIKQEVKVTDWRQLEQEGVIEEVPEWFWHKDSNNILNGGRSRPDAPPTKIPLDTIVQTLKMCLETTRFESSREARCKDGVCTSTPRNPCPWYNLGLLRCRTVRAKAYKETAIPQASP